MPCTILVAFYVVAAISAAAAYELESPCSLGAPVRCLRWLRGEPCPVADDPAGAVRAALKSRIVAQDSAIEQLVSAVESWDYDRRSQHPRPLVLALTGSTGVGKTQTALAIAEALLLGRLPQAFAGTSALPEYLVRLNGADFAGDSGRNDTSAARVRAKTAQGLYECGSGTVVIFDEAQKVPGEVLGALVPLMQRVSPSLTYFGGSKPVTVAGPSSVFIIVSDAGVDTVAEYVSLAYTLESGFLSHLAADLRAAFAREWETAGVNIATLAQAVVAFLPFNQTGAVALLTSRLKSWVVDMTAVRGPRKRGGDPAAWDAFSIHNLDEVAALLSDPTFTSYGTTRAMHEQLMNTQHSDDDYDASPSGVSQQGSVNADVAANVVTSEYNVANSIGVAPIASASDAATHKAGRSDLSDLDKWAAAERRALCDSSPLRFMNLAAAAVETRRSTQCVPCSVSPKYFVVDGARSLVEHSEGPLQLLQVAVRRAWASIPPSLLVGNASFPRRWTTWVTDLNYDRDVLPLWGAVDGWGRDASSTALQDQSGRESREGSGRSPTTKLGSGVFGGAGTLVDTVRLFVPDGAALAGGPATPTSAVGAPVGLRTRFEVSVECDGARLPDAKIHLTRCLLQTRLTELDVDGGQWGASRLTSAAVGSSRQVQSEHERPRYWRELCSLVYSAPLRT